MEILFLLVIALVLVFASTNNSPTPNQPPSTSITISQGPTAEQTDGGGSLALLVLVCALGGFILMVIIGSQI